MTIERRYDLTNLPVNVDYSRFAPEHNPEVFTEEEQKYLKPFFSNVDKPVFVTHGLPEEVNAALDSRYSRSTLSKRRLFLNEYVQPILNPETQKGWDELSIEERNDALVTKVKFKKYIDYVNDTGGIDGIVNVQRARGFFKKWLSEFGDDSIAEMGSGIHVSCEGISSVLLEEVVSKRLGISPIVKSTRYVDFGEKRPDGNYQYVVPGEIKGTEDEARFVEVMNHLFEIYSRLQEPYLAYIKDIFPKGEDETDSSFGKSRKAKGFDDLRDLLPFSTQNNIGLSGNGRAYEDLINRLLANELGEAKWLGQAICKELEKVVPSFVERPGTRRGAEIQTYRSNIDVLREEMAIDILPDKELERPESTWAKLVASTTNTDVRILASYLSESNKRLSLGDCIEVISGMSNEDRTALLLRILDERKFGKDEPKRDSDRFKKVPRAFEAGHYVFDVYGRGGDERDLHRHRIATETHNTYTTEMGFDLEREVGESPFVNEIISVFSESNDLYLDIKNKYGDEVAQYCVPFSFIQHWVVELTAREIYWIGELRTGPQARPHYKSIVLDIVDEAIKKDPSVFQSIMVDRTDYRLSRRESEKKIERRKQ